MNITQRIIRILKNYTAVAENAANAIFFFFFLVEQEVYYSHSVVPGGFDVKSYITQEVPGIFLISVTILTPPLQGCHCQGLQVYQS